VAAQWIAPCLLLIQGCGDQDVPRTGSGGPESVSTIFAHYRHSPTEAEGTAWFAIMPPHSACDVVHLPRARQGLKGPLRSWNV